MLKMARAEGRRVLLLGAGFIGSSTTRALLDRGHSVVVLTRSRPRHNREELLRGATLVVSEPPWLDVLPNLIANADDLIYCVGSSTPVESEADPANDISAVLPPLVWVLELIRLQPTTRLTFLSSGGTVYGNAASLPISEDSPTRPISSYGILKLACEHYIGMYTDVHGVVSRILRVSNPYGPTQDSGRGQGLVARLFECAQTGDPVTLVDWGKAVRDYLHIDDLAAAIAQSVDCDDLPAIMNVGSGTGHTAREIAESVCDVTGRGFDIRLEPPRAYDVDVNVLDITRAREHLGLAPRDLRQGLTETWSVVDRPTGATRAAKPRVSPRV
jgi:UDP-glucose 4-epimerase